MNDISKMLEKIVGNDNFCIDEPMSKHTSFRIGGIADYYIKVQNESELKQILDLAKTKNIPFQIVGNGTNLLVKDGGIRGFVIKLEMKECSIGKQEDFAYVTVGSGLTLAKLSFIALEHELTGLECMAGIPGTIGGAVRMNAGAYGKEMKDLIVFSKCMDSYGNIYELNKKDHKFGYRKSAFENNELIILETTLKLEFGNKEKIKSKMEECKNSRMQNQPLDFPNAGSTFKRNLDIPTAKLIDECGLKGFQIGDAAVSTKHAGFIVNKGNASAKDVLELVKIIKQEVYKKFNVELELEIEILGE